METDEGKRQIAQFAAQLSARLAAAQADADGIKCRGCSMLHGIVRTCRHEANVADCPGQPAAVDQLVLRYQQSRDNPAGHKFGQRRKC